MFFNFCIFRQPTWKNIYILNSVVAMFNTLSVFPKRYFICYSHSQISKFNTFLRRQLLYCFSFMLLVAQEYILDLSPISLTKFLTNFLSPARQLNRQFYLIQTRIPCSFAVKSNILQSKVILLSDKHSYIDHVYLIFVWYCCRYTRSE
jgi:hypothetical protein